MNIDYRVVENFLKSLEGMTFDEAVSALQADTKTYQLNPATSAKIASGIAEHFRGTSSAFGGVR